MIWGLFSIVRMEKWKQSWVGCFRTLRIILKNMQIAVTVCNEDIKFLAIRQEIGSNHFQLIQVFAKERHFVWFFLYCQDQSAQSLSLEHS